jgi:hypothetical protein
MDNNNMWFGEIESPYLIRPDFLSDIPLSDLVQTKQGKLLDIC